MTTKDDTAALCKAFVFVAEALGALETDEQRKRVMAAVMCLFADDHSIARSVVKEYSRAGNG